MRHGFLGRTTHPRLWPKEPRWIAPNAGRVFAPRALNHLISRAVRKLNWSEWILPSASWWRKKIGSAAQFADISVREKADVISWLVLLNSALWQWNFCEITVLVEYFLVYVANKFLPVSARSMKDRKHFPKTFPFLNVSQTVPSPSLLFLSLSIAQYEQTNVTTCQNQRCSGAAVDVSPFHWGKGETYFCYLCGELLASSDHAAHYEGTVMAT